MARAGRMLPIVLIWLAGCSLGGDDEAAPTSGATREIEAVVEGLERATAARDYRTICDDVLTAAARRRAGGRDCARLMRSAAGEVRRPRIHIVAIRIVAGGAEVRVRSRAGGQRPIDDTLELRREDGELRVESLG